MYRRVYRPLQDVGTVVRPTVPPPLQKQKRCEFLTDIPLYSKPLTCVLSI